MESDQNIEVDFLISVIVTVMANADTYVRARISSATKRRAAEALGEMGLSVSDAIRLLMLRVAEERRMPFEIKAPNGTVQGIPIDTSKNAAPKRFDNAESLVTDLSMDD